MSLRDGPTSQSILMAQTHAVVQGNFLGTDASGSNALGNHVAIAIGFDASDNMIGGTTFGAANLIANSSAAGVSVFNVGDQGNNPLRNAILGNQYSGNTGLNIDLSNGLSGGDGVTPNDNLDADSGPNDLQNFPVLQAALSQGGITGSLNSQANKTYRIEFYDTNGGNTSFIGSQDVTTDSSGNARISAATGTFLGSDTITATATLITNGVFSDTSEFSAGITAQARPL